MRRTPCCWSSRGRPVSSLAQVSPPTMEEAARHRTAAAMSTGNLTASPSTSQTARQDPRSSLLLSWPSPHERPPPLRAVPLTS